MGSSESNLDEQWTKAYKDRIPEGNYIVTNMTQDQAGTRIVLDNEKYAAHIFFDGIPHLLRQSIEGVRMKTWSMVQEKHNDKFYFRGHFLYEVSASSLVEWVVRESCGFYSEDDLNHYRIVTGEEIIDIVASFEPTIEVTKLKVE